MGAYESVVDVQGVNLANMVRDNFGYELGAFARDTAAVFAFGIGLRLIALACMLVFHRDKKR